MHCGKIDLTDRVWRCMRSGVVREGGKERSRRQKAETILGKSKVQTRQGRWWRAIALLLHLFHPLRTVLAQTPNLHIYFFQIYYYINIVCCLAFSISCFLLLALHFLSAACCCSLSLSNAVYDIYHPFLQFLFFSWFPSFKYCISPNLINCCFNTIMVI